MSDTRNQLPHPWATSANWGRTIKQLPRSSKLPTLLGASLLLFGWCCLAQPSPDQPTLAPAENLIAEGIPAIPGSIPERANRYTESRSAMVFAWHPQRREILIGTRFADTVQVHEVKVPGGARTQLTFFPDRVSGASYHSHAGDYFVFSKDIGGGPGSTGGRTGTLATVDALGVASDPPGLAPSQKTSEKVAGGFSAESEALF